MRRLLALAGLVAATVPVGLPPASAVETCSIQANHVLLDSGFEGFTAAVNCPVGVSLAGCHATAVLVYEPAVVADTETTTQGLCGNWYSTVRKEDTFPLLGSRHIEATFQFTVIGDPVDFTRGGQTDTFNCQGQGQVVVCTATSTSYSYGP